MNTEPTAAFKAQIKRLREGLVFFTILQRILAVATGVIVLASLLLLLSSPPGQPFDRALHAFGYAAVAWTLYLVLRHLCRLFTSVIDALEELWTTV